MTYKDNSKRKPSIIPLTPEVMAFYFGGQLQVKRSTLYQAITGLGLVPEVEVTNIFRVYHVGATVDGSTVLPQVDMQGNVRTALMKLYSLDCRPIEGTHKWMHYEMKRKGLLSQTFTLTQCPFGEELIGMFPEDTVCIVPEEATAMICALYRPPKKIWVAVGCWLRFEMLGCLQGRDVLIFPDKNLYEDWSRRAQYIKGCKSLQVVDWYSQIVSGSRFETIADAMIDEGGFWV